MIRLFSWGLAAIILALLAHACYHLQKLMNYIDKNRADLHDLIWFRIKGIPNPTIYASSVYIFDNKDTEDVTIWNFKKKIRPTAKLGMIILVVRLVILVLYFVL